MIFENPIPERAAIETAAGKAVKLWLGIARNDAQTPCRGRVRTLNGKWHYTS